MCRKALVLAGLVATAPAMVGAQQWYNAEGGITERSWIFNSRAGSDLIVFVWVPTLPTFSTLYFAAGKCTRSEDGEGVGKNRVTFRNILMLGGDSNNQAGLGSKSGKMKNGVMKNGGVAWDITALVQSSFSGDSLVAMGGEVVVNGRVAGFDDVVCRIEVVEILDPNSLASASSEERLQYFHQVQQQRRGDGGPPELIAP